MKKIRIEAYALPQNTMNYIARKAKTTAINVGLSYDEEEDLKQHLCLCVVRARENYDAAKRMSLESYLHMEIDAKTKNFLRDRQARKRVCLVLTLDAPVANGADDEPDSDETKGVDLVPDEKSGRDLELADLRHDVAYALSQIKDERVRTICKLVMEGVSYVDIAKVVGVPEWKIRQQILPSLVPVFKKALNS